ncbi:hypothetical protein AWB83_03696 [Caballeronia ptereochthonis]|uniref:Uncharacterized protein n=1 Tax=Caballeronia ptereochthonis TaxID=1777144 RepID=A0A158BYD8_9BURK|nr:hypothetical protein AWB83_03696 [Caballeronia ptereochthonis]
MTVMGRSAGRRTDGASRRLALPRFQYPTVMRCLIWAPLSNSSRKAMA